MTLAESLGGDSVFVDANVFVYHFGGRSLECKTFLERCARREVLGYTSTPILAEVLHRLMIAEAIAKGLVTAKTAVRKLGESPELVKQLTQYQEDVNKISQMNLTILALTPEIVRRAAPTTWATTVGVCPFASNVSARRRRAANCSRVLTGRMPPTIPGGEELCHYLFKPQ